jgi:hypothetical protein
MDLVLIAVSTSKIGKAKATRQKPAAVLPMSISRKAAVVAPKMRAPITTAIKDKNAGLSPFTNHRLVFCQGQAGC